MKKLFLLSAVLMFISQAGFAMDTVFDSMDKATEVKLSPSKAKTASVTQNVTDIKPSTKIQEQKYNSVLVDLDDAQVELRQDLTVTTTRYNEALVEKKRAIANCKAIKKEIKTINRKMKNIEKSKKMINKNLEATT